MDKRNSVNGYYFSRNYSPDQSKPVPQPEPDPEIEKSPSDSLLSIVYAIDERTQLPMGDLTYLVSDKANPQVKQFILDNLLRDVSAAQNPSIPDGMSDDIALSLTRERGESVQDYANRLNETVKQDVWMINEYKKQNVPAGSSDTPVSDE